MSEYKFKKLVKERTKEAGFKHLVEEKNRQSKICDIQYKSLEIQEYLMEGNKNTEISKVIFKLRGKTLEIKTMKKWKYEDDLCVGCGERSETIEELLTCAGLADGDDNNVSYNIDSEHINDLIEVAKRIKTRLKVRKKIIDDNG